MANGSSPTAPTRPATLRLSRGDVLKNGRYRLIEQLPLPANQQGQGSAWVANDAQYSNRRVVVREMLFPDQLAANKEQTARSIGLRLAELGQHAGIPGVLDMFSEKGSYYIVFQHIEGETLASLLRRQGGALSERMVAAFGTQLCEILAVLASARPPLVHGAVNPETIVVSPDKTQVWLTSLPLFTPIESTNSKAVSGYSAPEQQRGSVELSSDIYGLAATLHHAVTGFDPRERMVFFYPPARRLNPAVTPEMEAVLAQALRLSTSQRYARISNMQADLTSLQSSYPSLEQEQAMTMRSANPLLGLSSTEMRRRSRRRGIVTTSIFAGVCAFLLLAILLVILRPAAGILPGSMPNLAATATSVAQQAALNRELTLEAQTFQQKGLGISDGRFIFDIYNGLPKDEVSFKKQAAQAFQQGDLSGAVNLLTKAINVDPTDGEAQIYNENVHILQSNAPYVTIVLGLPIDKTAGDLVIARADMQSTFIAQHEINKGQLLPHGLQLRLLVDNSGENNDDVGTVAQFIQNRVNIVGNLEHIIAVVGWPFSSQTINAESIIAAAHIPIVSQTASSVKLSGSSPYFFRVNPPDDLQGSTLGTFAVKNLKAKNILVLRDHSDTYSNSLADAFTRSVQVLHANVINSSRYYFTEGKTTVADYRNMLRQAFSTAGIAPPDLIFIAGLDVDAVPLANALGNASREAPNT
ncbi:MAG: ABC transporter substrate-binding protein, partial [Chloroflexota bacterium]|nr:ABC transporter substrate-binding protein [Chloroflexota bacterium]